MKVISRFLVFLILITVCYKNINENNPGINIYKLKSIKEDEKIKYICTYDFCDYLRSINIDESIEIFMDKYLKQIKDEEIKNTLKVKGVTITKIIKHS